MENTLTLEVNILIKASKAAVWKALTDPDQIKKYLFGTETVSDWAVGGPITFGGVWEGKPYLDKGTILQIEKEKVLKYNYWSTLSGTEDKPENYANIVYSLEEKNGETVFSILQDSIKTNEALEHSQQNWKMVMDSLKELLEQKD